MGDFHLTSLISGPQHADSLFHCLLGRGGGGEVVQGLNIKKKTFACMYVCVRVSNSNQQKRKNTYQCRRAMMLARHSVDPQSHVSEHSGDQLSRKKKKEKKLDKLVQTNKTCLS